MKKKRFIKNLRKAGAAVFVILISLYMSISLSAAEDSAVVKDQYENYCTRFDQIKTKTDIEGNGFHIIDNHTFPVSLRDYGEVLFIPAMDSAYNRMAVFLVKNNGEILYKTDQLETNNRSQGEMNQPNKGFAAVSFQDVNEDGLTDILLITFCENQTGAYAGKIYKVGDVLFQNPLHGNTTEREKKEPVFYRDYRLSEKVNRYNMNKSIKFMTSYLVQGNSTEFLYTATTLEELKDHGFQISTEQSYLTNFEKWGRLSVVPGTYRMAEYSVFMIYLVNEQGYIVWSFQPMGEYENLRELKGLSCKDIDGDGLKDIVIMAHYSFEETDNVYSSQTDYSIYYQRSNGFFPDTEVKSRYQCTESDTLEEIEKQARNYWGWGENND